MEDDGLDRIALPNWYKAVRNGRAPAELCSGWARTEGGAKTWHGEPKAGTNHQGSSAYQLKGRVRACANAGLELSPAMEWKILHVLGASSADPSASLKGVFNGSRLCLRVSQYAGQINYPWKYPFRYHIAHSLVQFRQSEPTPSS